MIWGLRPKGMPAIASGLLLLFFQPLSPLWPDEDQTNKVKGDEEESSTVSVDRAREMMEYEKYLSEKQNAQERLRGVSKTQERLKDLREGGVHNEKKNKQETMQQKFLKEKVKGDAEDKANLDKKEKPPEEREEAKADKRKPVIDRPVAPALISFEEEEKKKNNFYKMKLLVDYRSAGEVTLKEKLMKEDKDVSDKNSETKPVRDEILDNAPFIREISLDPYAFENEQEER